MVYNISNDTMENNANRVASNRSIAPVDNALKGTELCGDFVDPNIKPVSQVETRPSCVSNSKNSEHRVLPSIGNAIRRRSSSVGDDTINSLSEYSLINSPVLKTNNLVTENFKAFCKLPSAIENFQPFLRNKRIHELQNESTCSDQTIQVTNEEFLSEIERFKLIKTSPILQKKQYSSALIHMSDISASTPLKKVNKPNKSNHLASLKKCVIDDKDFSPIKLSPKNYKPRNQNSSSETFLPSEGNNFEMHFHAAIPTPFTIAVQMLRSVNLKEMSVPTDNNPLTARKKDETNNFEGDIEPSGSMLVPANPSSSPQGLSSAAIQARQTNGTPSSLEVVNCALDMCNGMEEELLPYVPKRLSIRKGVSFSIANRVTSFRAKNKLRKSIERTEKRVAHIFQLRITSK